MSSRPAADQVTGRAGALGQRNAIRVLLVDDHKLFRQGLRSVLDLEPDITVVADTGTLAAARRLAAAERPDVVLLDLRLADGGIGPSLAWCEEFTRAHAGARVIILTMFFSRELVGQAVRSGARGYVLKDVDARDLSLAIRAVHRGELALGPEVTTALLESIATTPKPATALTSREVAVIEKVAAGLTNADIGRQMFISTSTVKFHLHSAMTKLAAHNRAELLHLAILGGVLRPDGVGWLAQDPASPSIRSNQ